MTTTEPTTEPSTGRTIELDTFTDDDGTKYVSLRPVGDERDEAVIEVSATSLRAMLQTVEHG